MRSASPAPPVLLLLFCLWWQSSSAELESSLSGEPLNDASYGQLLSRHRRFLALSSSGWSLRAGVSLVVPIVSLGKAVTFAIPFLYNLYSGV